MSDYDQEKKAREINRKIIAIVESGLMAGHFKTIDDECVSLIYEALTKAEKDGYERGRKEEKEQWVGNGSNLCSSFKDGFKRGKMEGQVEAGLNAFGVCLDANEKARQQGYRKGITDAAEYVETVLSKPIADKIRSLSR